MADIDEYKRRRAQRLKNRRKDAEREDHGVKGMKWGIRASSPETAEMIDSGEFWKIGKDGKPCVGVVDAKKLKAALDKKHGSREYSGPSTYSPTDDRVTYKTLVSGKREMERKQKDIKERHMEPWERSREKHTNMNQYIDRSYRREK